MSLFSSGNIHEIIKTSTLHILKGKHVFKNGTGDVSVHLPMQQENGSGGGDESGEPSPTAIKHELYCAGHAGKTVNLTIAVLGWKFSGKTTLCMKMMGLSAPAQYEPSERTHKYSMSFTTESNANMIITYVDTPGNRDASELRKKVYRSNPDAYIFVYDTTSFDSFAAIQTTFLPEIEDVTGQEHIMIPCLLLGNKIDAATVVPRTVLTREVAFTDGEQLSWEIRGDVGSCRFVEVSATTGQGHLEDALENFLTTVADYRMRSNVTVSGNKKKWKRCSLQ